MIPFNLMKFPIMFVGVAIGGWLGFVMSISPYFFFPVWLAFTVFAIYHFADKRAQMLDYQRGIFYFKGKRYYRGTGGKVDL